MFKQQLLSNQRDSLVWTHQHGAADLWNNSTNFDLHNFDFQQSDYFGADEVSFLNNKLEFHPQNSSSFNVSVFLYKQNFSNAHAFIFTCINIKS